MIVDSHCHLHYLINKIENQEGFTRAKESLYEILKTCEKWSVKTILNVSTQGEDAAIFLHKYFQTNDNKRFFLENINVDVFFSLGWHPCEKEIISLDNLELLIQKNSMGALALGETGIDTLVSQVPIETQLHNLECHILVANKYKLPVIIHCREGEKYILQMLQKYPMSKFILHCFAGDKDFLRELLPYNTIISFSGLITYKSTIHIQEAATIVPMNRIIFETDSPFLIPHQYRKEGHKENKPYFTLGNIEKVAQLKQISVEELVARSHENFMNFMFN